MESLVTTDTLGRDDALRDTQIKEALIRFGDEQALTID